MERVTNVPTREQLLLMERFTERYNAPPFDGYVSMFSLSTVGAENLIAPEESRAEPCILVRLRETLPAGLEIPDEFEGVKVFVRV